MISRAAGRLLIDWRSVWCEPVPRLADWGRARRTTAPGCSHRAAVLLFAPRLAGAPIPISSISWHGPMVRPVNGEGTEVRPIVTSLGIGSFSPRGRSAGFRGTHSVQKNIEDTRRGRRRERRHEEQHRGCRGRCGGPGTVGRAICGVAPGVGKCEACRVAGWVRPSLQSRQAGRRYQAGLSGRAETGADRIGTAAIPRPHGGRRLVGRGRPQQPSDEERLPPLLGRTRLRGGSGRPQGIRGHPQPPTGPPGAA